MVEKVIFRNYTSFGPVYKLKDPGAGEFIVGKVTLY